VIVTAEAANNEEDYQIQVLEKENNVFDVDINLKIETSLSTDINRARLLAVFNNFKDIF